MAGIKLGLSDAYGVAFNASCLWVLSFIVLLPLSIFITNGSWEISKGYLLLSVAAAILGSPFVLAIFFIIVAPFIFATQKMGNIPRCVMGGVIFIPMYSLIAYAISQSLIGWPHAVLATTLGAGICGAATVFILKRALEFREALPLFKERPGKVLFAPGWVTKRRKEWPAISRE